MFEFTTLFIVALAIKIAVELVLARRQELSAATHRNKVPVPFRRSVPLKDHRKAADYTVARMRLARLSALYDTLLLIGWTFGGGLAWVDALWRAANIGPLATGAGFLLSVILINSLLELPVSIYRTFVIETRFGFNRMTPMLFATDLLRQTLMLVVIGGGLAFAALWLMQSFAGQWWIAVWAMWTAFLLLMIWLYPRVIAPLFNRFSPLSDRRLRARIEKLLRRTGFRSGGIFVMDGSKRSGHGNAYFTGLGRSKRIVFFDTLLDSLKPDEIEAVLAHELGHFKRKHIPKRLVLGLATSFVALAVLGWAAASDWFYEALGMTQASNHAALILFLFAAPVFSFFLHPMLAWGSRKHEFEADAYAAQTTDGKALIRALVKLTRENAATLTPDRLYSAFYDSHPPVPIRIARLQEQA
jgi:STE24 endopeptidase